MSLADCFRKAGKALDAKDRTAIEQLVAGGVSETDAVNQYLQTLTGELDGVLDQARAAGASVPLTSASFHKALEAARDANPNGLSVAIFDQSEYDNMDLYLYDNNRAGFAIEYDGTLVSVFKHPDSSIKGAIDVLVPEAIRRGANRLDAFDGFLTSAYARHGFVEKDRVQWDDQYAPDGWDKSKQGTPDVVYMEVSNAGIQAAKQADAQSVPNPSGIRRSTRVLAQSSGQDQGTGREPDGSLRGLPRDIPGYTPKHAGHIGDVARQYMGAQGLPYAPPDDYAPVDVDRAQRIAAEFDRMQHDPQNPDVAAAYRAMINETIAQYEAALEAGLKVEFIDFARDGDPYDASPRMAIEDITQNNHMWVFSTLDGFGSSEEFDPLDNPLLESTPYTDVNGKAMLVNDVFRVVHDYFGHAKEGVGFRAGGEENAWRAHAAMYSPLALRAMTTETRGQNSWVNYGPNGTQNRTAKAGDTVFADQKIGLLPEWVSTEGSGADQVLSQRAKKPVDPRGPRGDGGISTRLPTAVAATEDALTKPLVVNVTAAKKDRKSFEKNAAIIEGYNNYRPAPTADTPDKVVNRFITHLTNNLLWLHDQIPEDIRARSHLWYDGARNITDRWVDRFGLPDTAIAGVMAALSPQKDWYMNVSLAERVLDTYVNKSDVVWGDEMTATAQKIFGKPQYSQLIENISGKAISDLTLSVEIAAWIRVYDETFNDRGHRIVSPEGWFHEFATTNKGVKKKTGWGSLVEIAKAVSVIQNPTIENVNSQMGQMHKVRNFYNNIISPKSEMGDVTIDTHAIAAGTLKPLSGASTEVLHNFGSGGVASSSITGSMGLYPVYADAYRRAAKARGILPREMQSITWEAVRGLYAPGYKSQDKNVDHIDKLWDEYRNGKSSLEKTREKLNEHAGGITNPTWYGSPGGMDENTPDSSYQRELPQPGVSRRGAQPTAGGGRDGAASGAADLTLAQSGFDAWSGGGEVVEPWDINDHSFKPNTPTVLRVFHGTTHDFSVFEASRGNLEGQFGAVNYFTSSEQDANQNYAGDGPDLTLRVAQRAEQIENELSDVDEDTILELVEQYNLVFDPDSEAYPADLPEAMARDELVGENNQTMELFVRVDNPFVIGADSPWVEFFDDDQLRADAIADVASNHGVTVEDVEADLDTYEDEIDEARWVLMEGVENPIASAIQTVANEYGVETMDLFAAISDLGTEATHSQIEALLREDESLSYVDDPETGGIIGSHLIGRIIEEMGYDSIILKNADSRFSNMTMEPGTTHVHLFEKNKSNIKSATRNAGTFDPTNPDIYKQSAFHGTPHTFDEFSLDAIGTGEGAQMYGWGLYFAGKREVAEWYRDTLTEPDGNAYVKIVENIMDLLTAKNPSIEPVFHHINVILNDRADGKGWDKIKNRVDESGYDVPFQETARALMADDDLRKLVDDTVAGMKGNLYQADIPEDSELLDYDKEIDEKTMVRLYEGLDKIGMTNFAMAFQDRWYELEDSKFNNWAGQEFYTELSKELGGDKQASEVLSTLGFPGLRYENQEDTGYNYVIWDQDRVTVEAVNDELRQAEMQQQDRGTITLKATGERVIRLGKTSDPSTFLHESAHLFLEMEKQFAREFGRTEEHDTLLEWLGVDSFDAIGVEEHEKYAETFEVYLETGKAPSLALRDTFAAFRRWLTQVYKSLRGRERADLKPAIVEYFDRLLATDAEIEQAAGNEAFDQFFRSKEQAGMTDDEWDKYQKQRARATGKAKATLDEKLINELKKRKTREWKEEREPLIDEEKKRLQQLPEYAILRDTIDAPLDHQAVLDLNGGKLPGNLIGKTRKEGGMDPAEYSEVYGYDSPEKMIAAIAATPALSKASKEAAENRMIDKYGDILNDGSIEQEARAAIHNEEQTKLLLLELKALGKTVGARDVNREYLKVEAKHMIEGMSYKELKPHKYYRAEIRAAKKSGAAKNPQEAYDAKVQQIANHYLYREARDAMSAMEVQRRYVRGAKNRNYAKGQVHEEYIANIKAVANMYDMSTTGERITAASGILNWYATQLADENQFVDIALLDHNLIRALAARDAGQPTSYVVPHFDELTVEEMRGVYDQIRHLRFLGGQMSDERKAEERAQRENFIEKTLEHGGKDSPGTRGVERPLESERRQFATFITRVSSLRNMMRKLGAFKDDFAYDMIYREIEKANNRKLELTKAMYERFENEMGAIHELGLNRKLTTYTLADGSTREFHAESRFMLALYWGTETSREAIRQGFGMTDADVVKVLQDLTPEQLELVNTTWKVNETLWPDLSAASVEQYGVAPPKLEATPYIINGVTMTGGHQRLFYDSTEIELQNEREKGSSQNKVMPSKAGSLHSRVGSGGRAPMLSMNNVTRAMEDSIHFIAFAEAGRKMRTLVNNKEVRAAIEQKHGVGFFTGMLQTIDSITNNRQAQESAQWFATMMRILRRAATAKHLMWSVRNTIQQFTSIQVAMDEVGFVPWLQAFGTFMTPDGHRKMKDFVNERSQFMDNRASLVNREAAEYLTKTKADGKFAHIWRRFAELGFTPQTIVDSAIAYPAWVARYEQAMQEHGDEAKAASQADTSVAESVGSGSDLHLGGMFHSSTTEFERTFTLFGSWFNSYYQRVYKTTKGGTDPLNADAMRAVLTTPLMVATLSAALIADGPDDDEGWLEWMVSNWAFFMSGTMPILRDLTAAFKGYSPSTVWSGGGEAPARLINELSDFENESALKKTSDITKVVTTVVPVPGIGNLTRVADYVDSAARGREDGDKNWFLKGHQALTEGRDQNR